MMKAVREVGRGRVRNSAVPDRQRIDGKPGKLDEAIEWLEKAKSAPRYEPRHFPRMNLGRIYAQEGMVLRAIREFEAALELHPEEPTCLSALAELRAALN